MSGSGSEIPQILLPYPGPSDDPQIQDIFVYLRPETNGVLVESLLLNVIKSCGRYRSGIKLIYLANFPGEYILDHHVIERHYSHKFFFAVHGKRAFTTKMKRAFEHRFGRSFDDAPIIGSFEALAELEKSPEQLFSSWVPSEDMLHVDGQSIKKIDGHFVVNYDIPALLHKNNRGTDIAVMLFRCSVDYDYFHELVDEMREVLVEKGVLNPSVPASRAFHFSKGPFEQLLDAADYLCDTSGTPRPIDDLSFVRYAGTRGYTPAQLQSVIEYPVCLFETDDGTRVEESIFSYTADDSYEEAIDKLDHLRAQLWIH